MAHNNNNNTSVNTDALPFAKKIKNDLHVFSTKLEKDSMFYSMKNKVRGRLIIFNHEEYDEIDGNAPAKRFGTNEDVKNLCQSFEKLDFVVEEKKNLTHAEIISYCKIVSKKKELKDYDCFVMAVLTHGFQQEIIYAKDTTYNVKELVEPFVGENCPNLANKPKLFFIQACKGEEFQTKINLRTVTDSRSSGSKENRFQYSIPANSDVLIAYATLEGFVALRHEEVGSPFITELCNQLNMYGKERDLLTMLIYVHHTLATKVFWQEDEHKQWHEIKVQPSFLCYLNRFVKFSIEDTVYPHTQ